MNKKDLLIISYLRQNARETLTNMSKKTNIPISTLYERLKMQDDGIIKKHTTLIDFSKLGYSTWSTIMIKVNKDSKAAARDYLAKHNQSNSVYRVNNGFDFMIEGVFRHLKEVEEFLDNIDELFTIERKEVYHIIDDIKRESFMSDPKLIDYI